MTINLRARAARRARGVCSRGVYAAKKKNIKSLGFLRSLRDHFTPQYYYFALIYTDFHALSCVYVRSLFSITAVQLCGSPAYGRGYGDTSYTLPALILTRRKMPVFFFFRRRQFTALQSSPFLLLFPYMVFG